MSWAKDEVCITFRLVLTTTSLSSSSITYIITGIYAPGYAQRRAERIKEAYGIDVPEHSSLSSTPN